MLERARGRYRFRHALVRGQLAAGLSEEALRRAHADAAAVLAAEDSPPERVAYHLLGAGRPRGGRPAPRRGRRVGLGGGRVPRRRDVGRAGARARARSASVRACSRCARSCSTAPASPTRRPPTPRQSRSRRPELVPALRVQHARACVAAGDIAGAKDSAGAVRGRAARGPRRVDLRARHGRVAHRRLGGRAPGGRGGGIPFRPIRATSPS